VEIIRLDDRSVETSDGTDEKEDIDPLHPPIRKPEQVDKDSGTLF